MKKNIFHILFFLFVLEAAGQSGTDTELLKRADFSRPEFEQQRKVEYLFKGKSAFVKYNPLCLALGGLMLFYQKTISVQIGANCPYELSCSAFSKYCISHYGLIKGVALSADRLMRCTYFSSFDLSEPSDFNERSGKILDDPEDYKRK